MLEEFLGRAKVAERMQKDYAELTIDTDRMTHGQAIFDRLKQKRSGGLPWLIVLDGDGKELVTGVGPAGNIGAPVEIVECAHFLDMLKQTRQRLTDGDLAVIAEDLEVFAKPKRRPVRGQ